MKVALLSFHNAYNYGAALQAYSLQKVIEDHGQPCEYINYINKCRRNMYDMIYQFSEAIKEEKFNKAIRLLLGFPFMAIRAKQFNKFYKQHIKMTTRIYKNSEEAKELNRKYDMFIVGSDQVWNPENNGADWAFLLDFVDDNKKKNSFSSSFGISEIPKQYRKQYLQYLVQFNNLSVREEKGINIIKELTGKDAKLVLDPVFLIEKKEWEKLIKHEKKHKKEYIFFYTNRKGQIEQFLNTGYPIYGKSIHILSSHVTVKDFIDIRKKIKFSMSPLEFLREVYDAELVVTASFHCVALSIILHKQFCVFLTGDSGKDERILNILKITGLESRVISSVSGFDTFSEPIDYNCVDYKLKDYIEASLEFLFGIVLKSGAKKKSKYYCKDDRCTGCSACFSICPTKAISFCRNNEGFFIPSRKQELCINCGRCYTVCQIYNNTTRQNEKQIFYAVKNTNEIRQMSSSGGGFVALAKYIFNNNGIVYAAIMDKDFQVVHKIANNIDELERMRGTYYVQSDIRCIYNKIKENLKIGKTVLFVGTPCQVKGLRLYLDKIESKNLLCCDLICHGVGSQIVFDKFIDYLKRKGELSSYKFRDKNIGWSGYNVSAIINGKKYYNNLWLQTYNKMFSHNMINRKCCGKCMYSNLNRPGDITIGDYWGIEKYHKKFVDKLGVSLIILNTQKGKEIFKELEFPQCIQIKKEECIQNSLKKSSLTSKYRNIIFKELDKYGYEYIAKKYGEYNMLGYIKNYVRKVYN